MHSGTQPLCSLSMRQLRGWKLSWEESWGKAPTGKDIVVLERSSPPEVKHWHGAAPDCWFSHLAVEVPGEGTSNEWCEPMPEETYKELR